MKHTRCVQYTSSIRLTASEIINGNCILRTFPNVYIQQSSVFLWGGMLFHDALSIGSMSILLRIVGWLMNEEEFGRKRLWPDLGIILAFAWRAGGEERNTVRITGVRLSFEPRTFRILAYSVTAAPTISVSHEQRIRKSFMLDNN
jgi:hypothetical protein